MKISEDLKNKFFESCKIIHDLKKVKIKEDFIKLLTDSEPNEYDEKTISEIAKYSSTVQFVYRYELNSLDNTNHDWFILENNNVVIKEFCFELINK